MGPFTEFLERLLSTGSVRFRDRPRRGDQDRTEGLALLTRAFEEHRLEVAGPPIAFDPLAALAAAEVTWAACWFLVEHSDAPDTVQGAVRLPHPANAPGVHLSADLTLRFLPQVHRRARGLGPEDVLTPCLAGILRSWPLSGALADIPEGPTTAIDFGGHPGLQMLYAERLAEHPRAAWVPPEGHATRGVVELVFAERGTRIPGAAGEMR